MSVEQTPAASTAAVRVSDDVSKSASRLAHLDISTHEPRQVGPVQTCRGSPRIGVFEDKDRIVVYNSGTAGAARKRSWPAARNESATTAPRSSARRRRDPKADPSKARITRAPRLRGRSKRTHGRVWRRQAREGTQETARPTSAKNHCVPDAQAGGRGLLGQRDHLRHLGSLNPKRLDAVTDPGFAMASATFNTTAPGIFTDEWGGGSRRRCRSYDPRNWAPTRSTTSSTTAGLPRHLKLPAPQTSTRTASPQRLDRAVRAATSCTGLDQGGLS